MRCAQRPEERSTYIHVGGFDFWVARHRSRSTPRPEAVRPPPPDEATGSRDPDDVYSCGGTFVSREHVLLPSSTERLHLRLC